MTRDLSIPLGAYREIVIRFPEQQLTETDWQIMLDVLTAMRPALVEPDLTEADDDRETVEQDARDLAAYALTRETPPPYWRADREDWARHITRIARRRSEEA